MGYAIVDRSQQRDPPLPPSRFPPPTPPRRRKTNKEQTKENFTTSRPASEGPPIRPHRNYSTLGGGPQQRRKRSLSNLTDEEKENIDITQYMEIDGERNLESGDVVQKMRERPLPTPPRPPRKIRESSKMTLKDITNSETDLTIDRKDETINKEIDIEEEITSKDASISNTFITPTRLFHHQETITHGSLVIAPIDNAEIIPRSQLSQEDVRKPSSEGKVIPVEKDYEDDDEFSEIPEEFHKLKNPDVEKAKEEESKQGASHFQSVPEISFLRASKLQVADLDVDKLTVNELLASKIKVSEIESGEIQVSEINSKGGNLVIGGIELPTSFLKELIEKLQAHSQQTEEVKKVEEKSGEENVMEGDEKVCDPSQKKTPTNSRIEEQPPERPPRRKSDLNLDKNIEEEESEEIKTQQPRKYSEVDLEIESENALLEQVSKKNLLHDSFFEEDEMPELYRIENEKFDEGKSLKEINLDDTNANNSQEEFPPPIPPRKKSLTEVEMQELEDQILLSLEEELVAKVEEFEKIRYEQNLEQHLEEVQSDFLYNTKPERPTRTKNKSKVDSEGNLALEEQTKEESLPQRQTTEGKHSIQEKDSESNPKNTSEEEPPPRPPQPFSDHFDIGYLPSQPPPSFYNLRSPVFIDVLENNDDIPRAPRRRRQKQLISNSSSEEEQQLQPQSSSRRRQRTPEASIPQLTGQLTRACGTAIDRAIKRLIAHLTNNVLDNSDGRQDLHVMVVVLLILIAGLILLGFGGTRSVHYHHWEYFNPPKEL